ncbi:MULTISPECIES: FHA domain-containing protein [Alteromonas]|jgi:hypothetical protein|uniref:FHA domain-containing protein n=1 Tax=Alteromonas TaxID=226 RepID=UPI001930A46F|nr:MULTISPECIES: FHA domain-containing protein [Alteromonas]|tara:strand:- start:455 stop:1189 length:735 start_codon:yes stop_codon:yes gene_type:complete
MAIKRGPDGVPIDMPSVKHQEEPKTRDAKTSNGPTVSVKINDGPSVNASSGPAPVTTQGFIFDEPPTAPAKRSSAGSDAPATTPVADLQINDDLDALPTVVGRSIPSPTSTDAPTPSSTVSDLMQDPVSGWLVVVKGSGKGHFLKLGFGQNSIGRGPTERVSINFGDGQISRSNHATISYDPRGNQFYIQPGSGTNMTYIDTQPTPVLQPMVLPPFSHISIGETTLRFVPLCGEQFTWDSVEED